MQVSELVKLLDHLPEGRAKEKAREELTRLGTREREEAINTTALPEECSPNPSSVPEGYGIGDADVQVARRLQKALAEKEEDLASRKRDLTSPYYADSEWVKKEMTHLEAHIAEIERHLKEGGALKLPPCCRQPDYVCLIATRGFDECIMSPIECGFSLGRAKWEE